MEETAEQGQLRCRVEHLVQRGTPQEVVGAFVANGADGVQVLQGGFGAPLDDNDERVSFAAYCLRRNRLEAWRAVIEANLDDDVDLAVAMGRTTSRRFVAGMAAMAGNETTAAEAAVIAASPAGLRLALDIDKSDFGRRGTLLHPGMSLHHLAVARLLEPDRFGAQRASSASGPEDDFRRALECCNVLRALRATWLPSAGGSVHAESEVMALMCTRSWSGDEQQEAAMSELLRAYVLDGMLHPGNPLDLPSDSEMHGRKPLALAGEYMCAPAIRALIGLGQSTLDAVPPFSGHRDLLDYLRASRRTEAPKCLAAAAEALLRRSLGAAKDELGVPPPSPDSNPARRRRVGL